METSTTHTTHFCAHTKAPHPPREAAVAHEQLEFEGGHPMPKPGRPHCGWAPLPLLPWAHVLPLVKGALVHQHLQGRGQRKGEGEGGGQRNGEGVRAMVGSRAPPGQRSSRPSAPAGVRGGARLASCCAGSGSARRGGVRNCLI